VYLMDDSDRLDAEEQVAVEDGRRSLLARVEAGEKRGRNKAAIEKRRRALVRARERAKRCAELEILEGKDNKGIAEVLGLKYHNFMAWQVRWQDVLGEAYEKIVPQVNRASAVEVLRMRHAASRMGIKAMRRIEELMDAESEQVALKAAVSARDYLDPQAKGGGQTRVTVELSAKAGAMLGALYPRREIRGEVEVEAQEEGR